jgi:acetoin utilization deacetylase AcuC-like enzyme
VTILLTHPDCLRHNQGAGHPERPERLKSVLAALDHGDFAGLDRREAPEATREQLARVHDRDFVDALLDAAPTTGLVRLDGDTAMSPGSDKAALRAAGAVVAAVEAVMGEPTGKGRRARTAFCAVRPPGHHAEPGNAMGFCLFNSVAVGAAHAQAVFGAERVAIVDFDVHHGNGTETMTLGRPGWLYASTHQYPFYPGTGAARDHGPHRNVVNAPLRQGDGGDDFRLAFEQRILPALESFAPDLLMISAGFDAHRLDPLASLNLDEADFAWATEALVGVARRHAAGRIVSTLEGGYDLAALASSAAAHVRVLMAADL